MMTIYIKVCLSYFQCDDCKRGQNDGENPETRCDFCLMEPVAWPVAEYVTALGIQILV